MSNENSKLRNVLKIQLWYDQDAMLAVGGDLQTGEPCIYADIVTDARDPSFMKTYVGQAVVDFMRLSDHYEQLSLPCNNRSLHYWIAAQEHRRPNFITMRIHKSIIDVLYPTELEEDSTIKTLITLVEMYFCL